MPPFLTDALMLKLLNAEGAAPLYPFAAIRLDHLPLGLSCSVWTGSVGHFVCEVPGECDVDRT